MNLIIGLMFVGLASGYCSGLLGIGGGAISVPALILLFGLDPKIAVGTSLFVIVPTALIGSIVHLKSGNVHVYYALVFLSLSLAGAFFGAKTATLISSNALQKAFAVLFMIIAVKMYFGK